MTTAKKTTVQLPIPITCPICNSAQSDEQPYGGTHVYTTNFKCGCSVWAEYSSDYWEIEQRCDEAPKKSIFDLLKADGVHPIFLGEKIPALTFGPCMAIFPPVNVSDADRVVWVSSVVNELKVNNHSGWVFIACDKTGKIDLTSTNCEWLTSVTTRARSLFWYIATDVTDFTNTTFHFFGPWLGQHSKRWVVGSRFVKIPPSKDSWTWWFTEQIVANKNPLFVGELHEIMGLVSAYNTELN